MSICAYSYDDVKSLMMMIDPFLSDSVWIMWITDGLMDGVGFLTIARGNSLAIIGGRRKLRQ